MSAAEYRALGLSPVVPGPPAPGASGARTPRSVLAKALTAKPLSPKPLSAKPPSTKPASAEPRPARSPASETPAVAHDALLAGSAGGAPRREAGAAADVEGPVHRGVLDVLRLRLGGRYLVQHTPNRPRSRVQGGREKRLGAVRGWPDLAVYGPGPAGPACWFAEIKPPGAPVPAYQREVHARLRAAGFEVRVLRGVADAEAALAAWGIPTRG